MLWVGVFRKKGEGISESHAFKAFKFCIPKETANMHFAVRKPFLYAFEIHIIESFFVFFPHHG